MNENDNLMKTHYFDFACKVLTPDGLKFQQGLMSIAINGDRCSLSSPNESFAVIDKDELISIIDKIKEIDRPAGLIPAQNASNDDKFPFEAIPGQDREGNLSAEPEIKAPVLNVGLRQLIEAEANKGHGYDEFKNAVLDLIGEHEERLQAKAENPAEVKTEQLGKDGIEQTAWQDFRDTGLPLLVNQLLHAFGWALVFFDDKGEGFDCLPKRVAFRGFNDQDMDAAYLKIAQYLKDNSDKLLEEAQA